MKSLILGIVAVFSLQIGFIVLTTSDNVREVAVRDLADRSAADPLLDVIEEAEPETNLSTPIFADEIAAADAPARARHRARVATAAQHFSESVEPASALPASYSFDKIVILYGSKADTVAAVVP